MLERWVKMGRVVWYQYLNYHRFYFVLLYCPPWSASSLCRFQSKVEWWWWGHFLTARKLLHLKQCRVHTEIQRNVVKFYTGMYLFTQFEHWNKDSFWGVKGWEAPDMIGKERLSARVHVITPIRFTRNVSLFCLLLFQKRTLSYASGATLQKCTDTQKKLALISYIIPSHSPFFLCGLKAILWVFTSSSQII